MKKPNPSLIHSCGYSCEISRAGAAQIIRQSRRNNFLPKAIKRKGDVYWLGSFGIKMPHIVMESRRCVDFFDGLELAARHLGVSNMRLYEEITGKREGSTLTRIWNNWLQAHSEYIPGYEAFRNSEQSATAA